MIIRENEQARRLLDAQKNLNLTEKNNQIWEQHMDLTEPEDPERLKELEHQDFTELEGDVRRSLYNFMDFMKTRNPELAGRYARFVAAAGGSTAKYTLFRYHYGNMFDFLKKELPTLDYLAIRSEVVAWDRQLFQESHYHFLVEMLLKHPDWISKLIDLCYDDDAANTHMFLSGIYLYCVKPLEDTVSYARLPQEHDKRATDDPDRIRENTDYLEKRLMGNIDGLFTDQDMPCEEDVEILKTFVREGDPKDPVPDRVLAIISNRGRHAYRMTFLPFLAFLGIEHSNRFIQLIRLALLINGTEATNYPLDGCLGTGTLWFPKHIEAIEEYFPTEPEVYLRWAIDRKQDEIIKRITKASSDIVIDVFQKLSANYQGYVMKQIKEGNPELYEKMGVLFRESYRKTTAEEEANRYKYHVDEIRRYLLGEAELSTILPYVPEIRAESYLGWFNQERLNSILEFGEGQLYRRVVVMEALYRRTGYFRYYWPDADLKNIHKYDTKNKQTPKVVEGILKVFEVEEVPAMYQLEFLGMMYDSLYEYGACEPKHESQQCVETLYRVRSTWHQEWIDGSKSKDMQARVLSFRVMAEEAETYKAELLACASETSKFAKEFVKGIFGKHKEWEADFLQMLKSKKAAEREMAVHVLKSWGVENYQEAFTQALEAEKSKKVKLLLQETLQIKGETIEPTEQTLEEKIKTTLMGGKKRKLAWFLGESLPKVSMADGSEASEDYLAAILISYADMNIPGINKDAKELAEKLNPTELAAYMKVLYEKWLKDGAEAKKKWVLYAAAIHGGDEMVQILHTQIQEWPKMGRGNIATHAVRALVLNNSSTAFLYVDQLARKFKFRQVKEAAQKALDFAAEQLQISREELEDRIVPNLGFENGIEQMFDYGKRTFRVVLTPSLTLEVYDEKGKQLKNMPSPGKTDDPEKSKAANDAWKLLKKQLKTVLANQKVRLEQTYITERKWTSAQWQALFIQNPVMHPFATGLIWGVYEEGSLKDTFRYMEDGSLNTEDEDEYELADGALIGLVHPVELSKESLEAWTEQLEDYEIEQPIEQLKRPVYRVTEEEKEAKELVRFGGMVLNGLSLSGKIMNLGWYRGEIEDAGIYYTFYRYDKEFSVELEFSGCGVDYGNEDVVVYEAYFYKPGNLEKVGYQYVPIREPLGVVNARYFSEVVLELTQATAASKERLAYPDCKNRL